LEHRDSLVLLEEVARQAQVEILEQLEPLVQRVIRGRQARQVPLVQAEHPEQQDNLVLEDLLEQQGVRVWLGRLVQVEAQEHLEQQEHQDLWETQVSLVALEQLV